MSDTIENQIRLGLRLVADDVQPPARTRAPLGRPLRVVAFAVALAAVLAGVLLGIVSRGQGPSARFVTDRFDYRPGGGSAGGAAGKLLPYSVDCCSALAASSATDAWTVGWGVSWHWDGSAWRSVPLPALRGEVDLSSVTAVDDGEAWAVGAQGDPRNDRVVHALVEHWDGSRWTVVHLPRTGVSSLFSVSASGPDDVWAVGMSFRRDARGKFSERLTRDLLLHWDGSAWSVVAVPWTLRPVDGPRVVTTGPDDVWVWGVAGEQVEHWDGASWEAVPAPFGPHDPMWGFSATSSDDAWAVGSYLHGRRSRTLAAHWDGQSWQIAPTPNPGSTDSGLNDVVSLGPDDVWAIGQSRRYGKLPLALFEHWDGRSWQITPGATPEILDGMPSLAATQDGTAWAMGSCEIDTFLVRWSGSAWTMAKHPRDQRWDSRVPRRIRRLGFGHCHAFRG
ncbi:MAG TPA: hypothetical protein VMU72_01005 [Gaiellaceae bacterium]|nr:hypothetical protein [Gaiellaceae bacterium]